VSEPTAYPFELTYEREPGRVIRGRATLPTGATPGAPVPFVLVLHGFKGFMDWGFFPELARRLAEAGLASVAFNTSSSGIGPDLASFTDEEGFARDTYSRQLEDFDRVREHVDAGAFPGIDPARAALFGHSRGGGAGLIHAAERGDYRALVTWAAIEKTERYDRETIERWRRTGRLPIVNARTGQTLDIGLDGLRDFEVHRERFDIRAACKRVTAPVLLVHGTADESVPVAAVSELGGALAGEVRKLVLDGAGHTFGAVHPFQGTTPDLERAFAETSSWLRGHLLGTEAGG